MQKSPSSCTSKSLKYNHPSVQPHICIGSDIVTATTTAKYLGVNFDCNLSCKHHAAAIIKALERLEFSGETKTT